MGNSYFIRIIFLKYSSQVYSTPGKSSFTITASNKQVKGQVLPREGRRHGTGERQLGRESAGRKEPWLHFPQGGRGGPGFGLLGVFQSTIMCGREGTPNSPGPYGGMCILIVGLPAGLVDSYCTGSLTLRSPRWTTYNTTETSGGHSHILKLPQHPEG